MSTFSIICSVIAVVLIFVGTLMQRAAKKREVTIAMHPLASDSFEPGMVVVLEKKPLTVLRIDREKGEVTLG